MDDEVAKAKAQKKTNALFVLACARGYVDDVKVLLDRGADAQAVDKQKVSGLHFACGQGRLEIVKFLWSRGVELDSEDTCGNLPLHYAIIGGKQNVVAFLLGKGAWVEGSNSLDDTPLHIAARKGQDGVVSLLLEHGAAATLKDVNKRGLTALGEALVGGHVSTAERLAKAGKGLDSRTHGYSLLHLSASLGCGAAVKFLLDHGSKASDVTNEDGLTPLHCAALSGSVQTAKILLAAGSDPAVADVSGRQPHVLVPGDQSELKRLLKTAAPPKTPLVTLKAAAPVPTNDLEDFQALDDLSRKARVERWAALEDPKQLDAAVLEFPQELRTQIIELQRLLQILHIQQAVVELLDDDDFQKIAGQPQARQVVEEVHTNREAFRKYAEDSDVMALLRALQRFQAVVRANGGHQIPFQSLLRGCEPGYQEKSLMRLKGMGLMLEARKRAAVAAALAGSEEEAKASAAKEMDLSNQRSSPSAGAAATASPGKATPGGPVSAGETTSERREGQTPGQDQGVHRSADSINRPVFTFQRLWRETLRSMRNSLIILAVFLAFVWITTGRLPWDTMSGEAAADAVSAADAEGQAAEL